MSSDQPKTGEEAELGWGPLSPNTVRAVKGVRKRGIMAPEESRPPSPNPASHLSSSPLLNQHFSPEGALGLVHLGGGNRALFGDHQSKLKSRASSKYLP